ncbi:MAG: AAA family ATPase, partial [Sphingobacterium sp.]
IWDQELVSENKEVYRAEYLAYKAFVASKGQQDFDAALFITQTVEQSYSEGYVKGVHNVDALLIYDTVKQLDTKLDLLRYDPLLRTMAQLFWQSLSDDQRTKQLALIHSTYTILKTFPNSNRYQSVIDELTKLFNAWETHLDRSTIHGRDLATYLFQTFTSYNTFVVSEQSDELKKAFIRLLESKKSYKLFEADIQNEQFSLVDRFYLTLNWLNSFVDEHPEYLTLRKYIEEAAIMLLYPTHEYHLIIAKDQAHISGLKGNHTILNNGEEHIQYHEFLARLAQFADYNVPRFVAFSTLKEQLAKSYAKELKIGEFEPKVLTSFVRNKLINEVYFPLIGNNLAKQLGAAGDNKRTARMGMLLLISPPGYGKTTLMEYLAKTMGLHFVKINGPTIGHSITSIDPIEAKTSGEREELKKINLAFEMADNVMLYLDDIQHLNPEFLQKFISLADGQRKIDGIFEGESKTYDLRGKRFCIVMAGNPYTESGSKFQIPDMLANRADVYNLGDVIGDTETLFNLSLIENAAIENSYLEKIAS